MSTDTQTIEILHCRSTKHRNIETSKHQNIETSKRLNIKTSKHCKQQNVKTLQAAKMEMNETVDMNSYTFSEEINQVCERIFLLCLFLFWIDSEPGC